MGKEVDERERGRERWTRERERKRGRIVGRRKMELVVVFYAEREVEGEKKRGGKRVGEGERRSGRGREREGERGSERKFMCLFVDEAG